MRYLGRNFVHQTRLLEQQRPLRRGLLRRLLAGLLVPPGGDGGGGGGGGGGPGAAEGVGHGPECEADC